MKRWWVHFLILGYLLYLIRYAYIDFSGYQLLYCVDLSWCWFKFELYNYIPEVLTFLGWLGFLHAIVQWVKEKDESRQI